MLQHGVAKVISCNPRSSCTLPRASLTRTCHPRRIQRTVAAHPLDDAAVAAHEIIKACIAVDILIMAHAAM
jgi:hypothetical protein